jgi:hypothetical protein
MAMKKSGSRFPENRIGAGIKTATLVVLLGVIAVVTKPGVHSTPIVVDDAPVATAAASAGNTDYFPSRFPAPTEAAEQSPTF